MLLIRLLLNVVNAVGIVVDDGMGWDRTLTLTAGGERGGILLGDGSSRLRVHRAGGA